MANRRPRMRNNIEDLCYLLQTAQLSSVQQLLESGQLADTAGRDGLTPLMWSVEHGDSDRFDLLVKYGANINKKDKQQRNCLHMAVLKKQYSIVQKLLKLGIDKNAIDSEGLTPLMIALMSDDLDMIYLIIHEEGIDINAGEVCISEFSALHLAVIRPGCHKVVPMLLQEGADIDRADSLGRTPLAFAIKGRHIKVARTLLENSADVNKSFPLTIATEMLYREGAALLLSFGADPARWQRLGGVEGLRGSGSPFSQLRNHLYGPADEIMESMISEDGSSTSGNSNNYMLRSCSVTTRLACSSSTLHFKDKNPMIYKLLEYGLDIQTVLKYCKTETTSSSQKKCTLSLDVTNSPPIPVPLPLFLTARNQVRVCLGKGISQKAKKLNIPERLREVLTAKLWDYTDWIRNGQPLQFVVTIE